MNSLATTRRVRDAESWRPREEISRKEGMVNSVKSSREVWTKLGPEE